MLSRIIFIIWPRRTHRERELCGPWGEGGWWFWQVLDRCASPGFPPRGDPPDSTGRHCWATLLELRQSLHSADTKTHIKLAKKAEEELEEQSNFA